MASRRLERLNAQFRREISDILRRDVRDPRVGSPTVTRVEVTPDLRMARVYVRIAGIQDERTAVLDRLDAAAAFIRRELGGLRIRRVPELHFEADLTLEHASRIEELLREVSPEQRVVPDNRPQADDEDRGEDR